MSTNSIYTTVVDLIGRSMSAASEKINYLDIGAGEGGLISAVKSRYNVAASACDYTDTLMKLQGQQVDIVNLNKEQLPYQDNQFDLITATEVIEHMENSRAFLRDIHRVLKPNGTLILSTPNVINLKSRLRYLWFGFPELMGPLHIGNRTIESCDGHINPISYFYIIHALCESGFSNTGFAVDKYQRSGMAAACFLWPMIKLWGSRIYSREESKYRTIDSSNEQIIKDMNSFPVLMGRTIIVAARKNEEVVN